QFYNKHQLIKTVTKGVQPEINILPLHYIPRPEITEELKKIFKKPFSEYYVIYGNYGIGKTTLIKTILKEIDQGVIYVDIPTNLNKLNEAFEKAFNFKFHGFILTKYILQKIFNKNFEFKFFNWIKSLEILEESAEIYKKKYNKPLIIIYNNADQLVTEDLKILSTFQSRAISNAKIEKYISIFVCNNNNTLKKLSSQEIDNLNKEESMNYLVNKRGINITDAENLYKLVGGHIMNLKNIADKFLFIKESFK
ncbi:4952_t:CDS:2, partial [Rhizophagus irregularis]